MANYVFLSSDERKQLANNRLKAPQYFFEWAKSFFDVYRWENKKQTIISSDRTKFSGYRARWFNDTPHIVSKRLTKKSSLTFLAKTDYFMWIGVTSKRIELQTYKVSQSIVDGKEKFMISLDNLEQLSGGKRYCIHATTNENYENGLQGGMFVSSYNKAWLFNDAKGDCKELFTRLKKSELKYIDFEKINKALEIRDSNGYFDIARQLSHVYKYQDRIEYAQNINAMGILADIVGICKYGYYGSSSCFQHANMGKITMKWLRTHKAEIKNSKYSVDMLQFKEAFIEEYGRWIDGVECYQHYRNPNQLDMSIFNQYYKHENAMIPEGVKPIRFWNWVVRNNVTIQDYKDYKNMALKLGMEWRGDYLVFPKNFQAAHDEILQNYNAYEAEKEAKKFKRESEGYKSGMLKKLLPMEQTIGNYQFLVPHEASEIIAEGKTLHHCVGTYVERHVTGKTTIIFVRDKEKPKVPLYTMEIRAHNIIQIRADRNGKVPDDAQKAANEFLNYFNAHFEYEY